MKRRRGHTLFELTIACAIFSAVVTAGTQLLIHALRSTSAGETRQATLDECRATMYRVSDELRGATAVVDPTRMALLNQGTPYIVFSTQTDLVGYRLVAVPTSDPFAVPSMVVQRVLFQPGYTPGIPGTQVVVLGSARNLTTAPSSLWFSIETDGGLPPGQGGTSTGPGTGLALALGTQKDTIQVRIGVTPKEAPPWTMLTKKTLWAGVFPAP